ncbi:hypothetical protein [Chryseobacterium sp. CT-SW4]
MEHFLMPSLSIGSHLYRWFFSSLNFDPGGSAAPVLTNYYLNLEKDLKLV